VQRYPTVTEPRLNGVGWYIDGVVEAYRELKRQGIRMTDQFEDLVEGDDLPSNAAGPSSMMFFTLREDTGLRHQFLPLRPDSSYDPRTAEGWVLPPVSHDDPLGLVCCSHHTVLTGQPERALKFVVDTLGGDIIHRGRNDLLGATSTYVYLAESVLEYAVPDSGTTAYAEWAKDDPNDTYYAITWKVVDLERVELHLDEQGVGILTRSNDMLVTDPGTSIGIPWGFSRNLVPGDPRSAK
jgi:hypothetical protein